MNTRTVFLSTLVSVWGMSTPILSAASEFAPRPAYPLLERLLRVPRGITVQQDSSHNKKGINGDADQPLYVDANGDDVIFDSAGPGCIRSMWGTYFDPAAVLKFYFDGETSPRHEINEIEFYQGRHPLFPEPLNSYARRGLWGDVPFAGNSFVPIPFEKSLKIAVRGKSRFFHIISDRYFNPAPAAGSTDRPAVEDAFGRSGERPFEEAGLKSYSVETNEIAPSSVLPLLKLEGVAGIVREIEIEGDGSEDFIRQTRIRLRWDGHPRWDVVAPTGMFFGTPNEANEMRSLPLRAEPLADGRVRLRCYFPMAFWEKAEIQWVNASSLRFGPVKARVTVSPNAIPRGEGTYFTALYHEGETIYGQDWLLSEAVGTGWLAGIVQSMRNDHYCEGNERFTLDEAVSPQINGTGSEDYYLACFWPNPDFDTPFGCVIGNIMTQGGGSFPGAYRIPSGYSRFHLEAPIPFYASLRAVIQHGGMSDIRSQYRSLAFCYVRRRPALARTDFLAVGQAESERIHRYQADPSATIVTVSASPEGENAEAVLKLAGRVHERGEISFRVSIDPDNRGVRLRRRIDQKVPRQKAQVLVDGQPAGWWYRGYENEHLRWYDLDFDLSPELTRGKDHLEVKLLLETGAGASRFTDFGYQVYCFGE